MIPDDALVARKLVQNRISFEEGRNGTRGFLGLMFLSAWRDRHHVAARTEISPSRTG